MGWQEIFDRPIKEDDPYESQWHGDSKLGRQDFFVHQPVFRSETCEHGKVWNETIHDERAAKNDSQVATVIVNVPKAGQWKIWRVEGIRLKGTYVLARSQGR